MPILGRLATIPRTAIRTSITQKRTMSTNWIVIVPDKAGVVAKRLEVRGQHLGGMKSFEASGVVKMGGEFLLP